MFHVERRLVSAERLSQFIFVFKSNIHVLPGKTCQAILSSRSTALWCSAICAKGLGSTIRTFRWGRAQTHELGYTHTHTCKDCPCASCFCPLLLDLGKSLSSCSTVSALSLSLSLLLSLSPFLLWSISSLILPHKLSSLVNPYSQDRPWVGSPRRSVCPSSAQLSHSPVYIGLRLAVVSGRLAVWGGWGVCIKGRLWQCQGGSHDLLVSGQVRCGDQRVAPPARGTGLIGRESRWVHGLGCRPPPLLSLLPSPTQNKLNRNTST